MAKQLINVGTSANSRTGDNLRTAFIKINENFNEVYDAIANGTGVIGHDGKSAYEIAVQQGFTGTIDQWLVSLRGAHGTDGINGTNGADGKSAYQLAMDAGFVGTYQQWLASLKGADGKSAYQIAVDNGFVGTEQQWLASLVGSGYTTNGSVFITDVVPATTGNVGGKVFSSGGKVLESCVTDTQSVAVSVMAMTGSTHYIPIVTVNGTVVTLTEDLGKFIGTVVINLNNSTTITAIHEDGPTDVCDVTFDVAPVITSAIFVNGYPGSQTELKAGDVYQMQVTADIPFVAIEVSDAGAFNAHLVTVTEASTTTFIGIIANRGNTVQSLGATIRVQKHTGSWSDYYNTSSAGSTDGVNVVKLNNISPSISIGTITYPASQAALKNSETATVANTITNADSVVYSSPNNELTIASPTQIQTTKTVTRIGGTYNVNTTNFRIDATRTANGTTASAQATVKIANVGCTITVSEPAARLLSGGTGGTSPQNYTITIISNQNLISAPTLLAGAQGTFIGTGFTGSGSSWTRSLQVSDSMVPGTYTWGNVLATNLAGIETTFITGDNVYTIGGFIPRTVTLDAYANEVSVPVSVTDYSKLSITWSMKSLPNKRAVGTTTTPDANSWTIDALNTNPTIIRILDIAATMASSSPSTITIQESV